MFPSAWKNEETKKCIKEMEHHLWKSLGLFFVPSRQERILGDVAMELDSPFSME